jgi:hypothetical protein
MAMVAGAAVRLVLAAAVVGYLVLAPAKRVAGSPTQQRCLEQWSASL